MRIVLIISSFYRGENSAERCKNLSMVPVGGGDLFQVISKLQSLHTYYHLSTWVKIRR